MKKISVCRIFIVWISVLCIAGNAYSYDAMINGFIAQGYLQTDRNNFHTDTEQGTFQFNEMGIKFSSAVSDHLFLGMQFFARDLGNLGNDEIVIDYEVRDPPEGLRWTIASELKT